MRRVELLGGKMRHNLEQFSAAPVIRAYPWLAGVFEKRVPDEYVAIDGSVDCPCGEHHATVRSSFVRAECGRWFLRCLGGEIHVAREP